MERSCDWLGRQRHISMDDEVRTTSEEAWILLAMVRLRTLRLTR